jgi:hypothetical protein
LISCTPGSDSQRRVVMRIQLYSTTVLLLVVQLFLCSFPVQLVDAQAFGMRWEVRPCHSKTPQFQFKLRNRWLGGERGEEPKAKGLALQGGGVPANSPGSMLYQPGT